MATPELPQIPFPDAARWDEWLREHHADSPGVWLQIAKRGSGLPSVTAAEAVPIAISWGWIDGQLGALDERHYLQRYTPRRPRSRWSKVNVEHAERLIAAGAMHPAGLAQVDAARADGRWEAAYSSIASRSVPPELQAALDANPTAAAAFAALDSANRFAMTYRVETAKRPETKARHVATFVGMLERGERIH